MTRFFDWLFRPRRVSHWDMFWLTLVVLAWTDDQHLGAGILFVVWFIGMAVGESLTGWTEARYREKGMRQ